ncbi:MAG: hypothetical protein GX458_04590 [Phyllobacteriaceae bacterium]|nr:hypothetical protein [Phyllobacteriaceae bacterium]
MKKSESPDLDLFIETMNGYFSELQKSYDCGLFTGIEIEDIKYFLDERDNIDKIVHNLAGINNLFGIEKYDKMFCEHEFNAATHAIMIAFAAGYYCSDLSGGAEKILRAKQAASGGRRSGQSRKEKAELGWKIHARELALAVVAENPLISQAELVEEIRFRWKLSNPRAPSARTLEIYVSASERAGWLQRKRRTKSAPPNEPT